MTSGYEDLMGTEQRLTSEHQATEHYAGETLPIVQSPTIAPQRRPAADILYDAASGIKKPNPPRKYGDKLE